MGLCTNCVRQVGARLGMVASSVERESQRRVSSYRVVARGASCQGQPRPLLPLQTASPRPLLPLPTASPLRRKSDCHRRHKHEAFSTLQMVTFGTSRSVLVFFLLCRALLWHESKSPSYRNYPHSSPLPFLSSPLLRRFLFFSEFFLCAVPLEGAGCNYVHVN
jgi:hypothetical protein